MDQDLPSGGQMQIGTQAHRGSATIMQTQVPPGNLARTRKQMRTVKRKGKIPQGTEQVEAVVSSQRGHYSHPVLSTMVHCCEVFINRTDISYYRRNGII